VLSAHNLPNIHSTIRLSLIQKTATRLKIAMYLTHHRAHGTGVDWGGLGLWAWPTLLMVNECRSIRAVESTKLPRKTFLKNECKGERDFLARCNFLAALQLLWMHKVPSHVTLLRSYTYKVFSLCHKYRSGASQPLITTTYITV